MGKQRFTYKRTATADPTAAAEAARIEADRQAAEAWAKEHGVTQCPYDIAQGSIEFRIINPRGPGRPRSQQ